MVEYSISHLTVSATQEQISTFSIMRMYDIIVLAQIQIMISCSDAKD